MKRDFLTLLLSALVVIITGCTRYVKMPLDTTAIADTMRPPSLATLKIRAQQIQHPMLKPIVIEESNGLDTDEVAVIAVLTNPKLRVERDKKGISAAQLYQAGILPNPQFSGSLDFPTGGSTRGTVNAYGLGLDYDIRSLISRSGIINAAKAHASSVNLSVAWQEWQVAESAKRLAYRVCLYARQLKLARDEEQRLQDNVTTVTHATLIGSVTIMDLAAARASMEKIHLAVLNIEQKLEQERLSLNLVLGFPPERTIPLQQDVVLPSTTRIPQVDELLNGIEQRRLDLLALKMGYSSQEERLRVAVLGQFPRISIGFSEARDTGNVITSGPSVTIGLPFFDRNQGQIAIERATRQQLFDEYAARLFEAQSNIARSRANIERIAQQVAATEAYIPVIKHLVQIYYDALLQGNADVLTYYNARGDLIMAQISLLGLRIQLIDHFIALEIAAGEYLVGRQGPEVDR